MGRAPSPPPTWYRAAFHGFPAPRPGLTREGARPECHGMGRPRFPASPLRAERNGPLLRQVDCLCQLAGDGLEGGGELVVLAGVVEVLVIAGAGGETIAGPTLGRVAVVEIEGNGDDEDPLVLGRLAHRLEVALAIAHGAPAVGAEGWFGLRAVGQQHQGLLHLLVTVG